MLPCFSILNLGRKSLVRGILLSEGGFVLGLWLAGFPAMQNHHGSPWVIVAVLSAVWGMIETARCLQRRWSLYHAGVVVLLWADLMILVALVALAAL